MLKKAVIYARYSSAGQREESIEDQIRECKLYAKSEGYSIIKTYADYAITGTTDDRAQFQLMIREAAKKAYEAILVYKTDRFARNRFDAVIYKKKLKGYGIRVLSAKEPIPDGPGGILLESFYESAAEMFSVNLSENVKRGMYGNAIKCMANCMPPFGYKINKDTRHYELDDITAPLVKRIFNLANDGKSMAEISDFMKSQGFPRRGAWVAQTLKNKRYTGYYIFGDVSIANGMPRIIDDQTFDQVNKLISIRKRAPRSKPENYLLTNKLYCGYCGSRMNGEYGTSRNGSKYRYYNCVKHKIHHCKKKAIGADFIEGLVIAAIKNDILNQENVEKLADAVIEYQKNEFESTSSAKNFERQLAIVDKKLTNMMAALEKGIVSNTVLQRIKDLEAEKKELEIKIASEKLLAPALTREDIIDYILSFKTGDLNDDTYVKKLVDTFVTKIYVYDDHFTLIYNVDDSYSCDISFNDNVCSTNTTDWRTIKSKNL